jgi:hypothetical protein
MLHDLEDLKTPTNKIFYLNYSTDCEREFLLFRPFRNNVTLPNIIFSETLVWLFVVIFTKMSRIKLSLLFKIHFILIIIIVSLDVKCFIVQN